MGMPAAKQGDKIVATDVHVLLVPAPPAPPVPTPFPLPFSGPLSAGLSANVKIGGLAAATVGSGADNLPPHIPPFPFQAPPSNHATVQTGSRTVRINGKGAARNGDPAQTCSEIPPGLPIGQVVAVGTVSIGG
ncbi:MAG TPA: PAAR domain-containing protein [Thermoanaerobaculia bacterium]|nr:PAAR domain-containing protein [Thermoanaerobaculia bacterium]